MYVCVFLYDSDLQNIISFCCIFTACYILSIYCNIILCSVIVVLFCYHLCLSIYMFDLLFIIPFILVFLLQIGTNGVNELISK